MPKEEKKEERFRNEKERESTMTQTETTWTIEDFKREIIKRVEESSNWYRLSSVWDLVKFWLW